MISIFIALAFSQPLTVDKYSGYTKVGKDGKFGVTVRYKVIEDWQKYKHLKNFTPGTASDVLDKKARYLYLYQAMNDSGFPESFDRMHIRLKNKNNLITSWGNFEDTTFRSNNKEKNSYYEIAPAVNADGIAFVAGEEQEKFEHPKDVAVDQGFLNVSWEKPVGPKSNSSVFGFTSDHPPTMTEVGFKDDYLGTVPVPFREEEPLSAAANPGYSNFSPGGTEPNFTSAYSPNVPGSAALTSAGNGAEWMPIGGIGGGNNGALSRGFVVRTNEVREYKDKEYISKIEKCCPEPLVTPEPASWIMGLIGVAMVTAGRRFLIAKKKRV